MLKLIEAEKIQYLRKSWRSFLLQVFLAFAGSCIVMALMDLQHAVIIASVGATAFIVFARPHSEPAKPRNVFLGQIVGLSSGIIWSLVTHETYAADIFVYSAAITTAFVLMVFLSANHPPAAGTALAVAHSGFHLRVTVFLVISITLLVGARYILRNRLKDLL